MCTVVTVKMSLEGGLVGFSKIVGSCGELAQAIGCELEELVMEQYEGMPPQVAEANCCLCPCDLSATAAKFKFNLRPAEWNGDTPELCEIGDVVMERT